MFRILVLFLSFHSRQLFESTCDCIYDAAPFISKMVTGSTGAYGGLGEEAPEKTMTLAKKEPVVDASGSSYDTPDRRSS